MTYRWLVEFCYDNGYCPNCRHLKECEVFKKKTDIEIPSDLYKVLYSDFDFDAKIEVEE